MELVGHGGIWYAAGGGGGGYKGEGEGERKGSVDRMKDFGRDGFFFPVSWYVSCMRERGGFPLLCFSFSFFFSLCYGNDFYLHLLLLLLQVCTEK